MAQNYKAAGSYQTVRIQSQTSVVDVELIGIYTKPSGIYVAVPVPLAAFKSGSYTDFLDTTAVLVEGILATTDNVDVGGTVVQLPEVVGASYVQDIDAAGLLSAFMDFTVAYTPTSTYQGQFSEIVRVPVTVFESESAFGQGVNGKTPIELTTQAYARLKKLATS